MSSKMHENVVACKDRSGIHWHCLLKDLLKNLALNIPCILYFLIIVRVYIELFVYLF